MKSNVTILFVLMFGVLLFTTGCDEEGLLTFEGDYSGINFEADSTVYSFLGNTEGEYVQQINVRILGNSATTDRPFEVEVINDEKTTAEPDDYEILGGSIDEGEFAGTLDVRLFNSDKLDTETVSLHLRIIDSEYFVPGNEESVEFTLKWTDQIVVPAWTYYRYFFCANPSTTAYRIFVETTGMTSFTRTDYVSIGQYGAAALGRLFGDYIKQYNLDHPDNPLRHADGPAEGQLIEPIHYTQSKFD